MNLLYDGMNELMVMLMNGWRVRTWAQRDCFVKLWLDPVEDSPFKGSYATFYI